MDHGTADQSERSLVGLLLGQEHITDQVADRLAGSHFADATLGSITDHLLELRRRGCSYRDPSVVISELKSATIQKGRDNRISLFDAAGGHTGLAALVGEQCAEASVAYHVDAIVGAFRRRSLLAILRKGRDRFAADEAQDADEIVSWIEAEIQQVIATGRPQTFTMLNQVMTNLADQMHDSQEREQRLGVPTGFPELDAATGGYFSGEITVIGAWTSIGKTAFAMQTAMTAAKSRTPRPTLVVSLEMREMQMAHRIAASEIGTDVMALRSGTHSSSDEQSVRMFARDSVDIPLGLYSARRATVASIRSVAQSFRAKHGLDLLVIDYLQLIEPVSRKLDRRVQVEQISNDLKTLAMELNVPVLALAQLNRDDEGKAKPSVKNLRESAAIGQDADAVWFIHRDNRQSQDAELIVDKNRQGPTFTEKLHYDGASFKFHEIEERIENHPNYHAEFADHGTASGF